MIPNQKWNQEAAKIVSNFGVPHWINATNPEGTEIFWNVPKNFGFQAENWNFSDWHQPSQQPNDCVVKETCIFIGPNGKVRISKRFFTILSNFSYKSSVLKANKSK